MTKSSQLQAWNPFLPSEERASSWTRVRAFGIHHSSLIIHHFFLLVCFAAPLSAQTAAPSVPVPAKAATDGRVWGALVYASDKKPGEAPVEPAEFPGLFTQLGKVFPYNHFVILGQHNQVIFREYESWLVPSKDLFVKLDSKGAAKDGGINLHLQFWQDQQVLVKTDAVLRPASPLFIAGPKWRDGRLIFVLELKP